MAAPGRGHDLAELNRLFSAWVERQLPPRRALRDRPGAAGPLGRQASRSRCRCRPRRSCTRRSCGPSGARSRRRPPCPCTATSTRSDASLVRCAVELVFDPFDLADIEVRHKGRPAGKAIPFVIGRHRHAKTRTADDGQRAEPEPTGIDYLRILDQAHGQDLQARINYAALITPGPGRRQPGHAKRQAGGQPWMTSGRSSAPASSPATTPSPWPAPPPRRSAA